jgi:hypothetical protein
MKKGFAVLIVICILLIGASANAAETIDQLTQIVEDALEQSEYIYTYDADYDAFDLEFSLNSSLASTDVTIYIYDDMVSVVAYSPLTVPSEYRDLMAKYLTLANNDMYYGQFRMDYESGDVACRSAQLVEDVLPGIGEITVLLEMPLSYMDNYGDGIAQISLSGADPDDAFEQARESMN